VDTATFEYDGTTTRDFGVLSLRGFDNPEEVIIVGVQHRLLDGSFSESIRGFNRVVTLDLGVLSDRDDRNYLLEWSRSEERQIRFAGDTVYAALEDPLRLQNEWLENLNFARRFVLRVIDSSVKQSFGSVSTGDDLMYFKAKVQITGTEGSPQTLTTNSAPLAAMETLAAWPTFNASTHKFHVEVNGAPYQSAPVYLANNPSVLAGNLTFQVAVGYGGNASGDGNYYSDIAIFLQTI
jgi:hypothetical protein